MKINHGCDGLVHECQHHPVHLHESKNRFEQIVVSARILTRNDCSRQRRKIPLPRKGTKSVDTLDFETDEDATRWEELTVPVVSLNRKIGT